MKLGTVYIIVNDIEKSINFYRKLLQEEPLYNNDNRWVQFSNFIALYNRAYDKKYIDNKSMKALIKHILKLSRLTKGKIIIT